MDRKKASDFDQEVLDLFDQYVHGDLDRRGFLERAARFAVGGVTAAMLLDALSPRFAEAQQMRQDDKRLKTRRRRVSSRRRATARCAGYLARPAKPSGKLPAVLVVHENRGLNPHIEDVARRIALEKFVAFAPDALTPLGGYPGDEDKARELFQQARSDEDARGLRRGGRTSSSAVPTRTGKVGVVGFCYGGGDRQHARHSRARPGRRRAFYGSQPTAEEVAQHQGAAADPLRRERRAHQRGAGRRSRPRSRPATSVPGLQYPGTQHGFNNDTTPRYDEAAAKLAWKRTIDFFKKNLR